MESILQRYKRNYRWCNSCPHIFERTCRYIFEELLHKKFPPRKPKFLEGLQLDGYNEELHLAFEYNGNQHFQIVPFFHPQGQINLDSQIQRDWKKRALCYKEGIILITILYCVVDLETFIKSALYAFGYLPLSIQEGIAHPLQFEALLSRMDVSDHHIACRELAGYFFLKRIRS